MGNRCCRRRVESTEEPFWASYRDDGEFIPPSTARERRQNHGTTSMSEEVLQEMAADTGRPRRAAHAATELQARGIRVRAWQPDF